MALGLAAFAGIDGVERRECPAHVWLSDEIRGYLPRSVPSARVRQDRERDVVAAFAREIAARASPQCREIEVVAGCCQ